MKPADAEIEYIMERAEASWRPNKLPKSRKDNFLLILKTYLTVGGVIENVCPVCLGSGFKDNGAL